MPLNLSKILILPSELLSLISFQPSLWIRWFLCPKFSGSHPLSLQTIHILMIVTFVWFYAWALGDLIHSWCMKTSRIKHLKTTRSSVWGFLGPSIWGLQSFLFKAMRQVSMNILHLYNFPVYSIVVVLHAHVIECAPMLGFTRIGLSFLENLRSIW
jgi:hypothetical protein